MSKKPKFKPEVIRVKLNPEQAVLGCGCWSGTTYTGTSSGGYSDTLGCSGVADRKEHFKGNCGRGGDRDVYPTTGTKAASS